MRSIVKIMLFCIGTIALGTAALDGFPKLISMVRQLVHDGEYDRLLPIVLWVGTQLFGIICFWVLGATL